jgi:hypothetical protein
MTLPFIPNTLEQVKELLIELENRITNIEGIGRAGLSHGNLSDIEDHAKFLKTDGIRVMRAELNMGDNLITRAKNAILRADVLKGEVRINPATNQLEVGGVRMKSFDIEPNVNVSGPSAPTFRTYQGFDVLDFNDSVVSEIFHHIELPHDLMFNGLMQMHVTFFVEAPADATVIWGAEYVKLSEGEVFNFAGTSTVETTKTLLVGDGTREIYKSGALKFDTLGWQSNDVVLARIYRDGVNDTYAAGGAPPAGAARVINFHFEYASNRRGEPLSAEQGE